MHAITHDGAVVADVELEGEEVALPPHHIQRMKRIKEGGVLALPLDPHLPLLLPITLEGLRVGHLDYCGVKGRITPQRPEVGELHLSHGLDHHEKIVLPLRHYPVRHSSR